MKKMLITGMYCIMLQAPAVAPLQIPQDETKSEDLGEDEERSYDSRETDSLASFIDDDAEDLDTIVKEAEAEAEAAMDTTTDEPVEEEKEEEEEWTSGDERETFPQGRPTDKEPENSKYFSIYRRVEAQAILKRLKRKKSNKAKN